MPRFLLCAALLAAGCSPGFRRASHHFPKVLATELAVAVACDVGQTLSVSNGGRWDGDAVERDPLIGPRPSAAVLVGSGVLTIAGAFAFAMLDDRVLPDELRTGVLGLVASAETTNVVFNARTSGRSVTWCGR